MIADLPILALIAAHRSAEKARQLAIAASGRGSVAARKRVAEITREELAEAVRCTATGWRGVGAR